jgi:hypothetical protein
MATSLSMEEAGGRCPCFVWKFSQLSVAWGKWQQAQQQNMVALSSSGLGNSKDIASPGYHAPWFELSTGLCATWSGIHQAEQASLFLTVVHQLSWIQGLILNTRCHVLIILDKQGRNEVTWSPSHLLIWHHLFSSHQVSLTKEMNVGQNCPKQAVFPGVHISMNLHIGNLSIKEIQPNEIIRSLTEWVPCVPLVTTD